MKARDFNSIMPYYHHKWCAKILEMNVNEEYGPDLIDKEKFVEIKFSLVNSKKHRKLKNFNYPKAWTVMEHQMKYEKKASLKGYWGLGIYELDNPVEDIKDKNNLDKFVLFRELYIVEWNWMEQFLKSHTSGKTEFSEWNYYLRYPKFKNLPEIILSNEVNGGRIHFTDNSQLDKFCIHKIDKLHFEKIFKPIIYF